MLCLLQLLPALVIVQGAPAQPQIPTSPVYQGRYGTQLEDVKNVFELLRGL